MQSTVEAFIAKWQGVEGGQERANYALFLTVLCDVLGECIRSLAYNPHPRYDHALHTIAAGTQQILLDNSRSSPPLFTIQKSDIIT